MPTTDLLDPKLDVVFKMQFAEQVDLLIDLINAIRSDASPVVELEIRNPQITAEELEGKYIVLDILAQDAAGAYYNVEMQANRHAGWQSRSVYYLARALSWQLEAGEGYSNIQPVVGIHLLDFNLFTEPDQALWTFEMRARQRHEVVLDGSLELNMLELPKADRLRPKISSVLHNGLPTSSTGERRVSCSRFNTRLFGRHTSTCAPCPVTIWRAAKPLSVNGR